MQKIILLSLLIFSFNAHALNLLDRIVAVINDDVVMLSELRREAQELNTQLIQRKVKPMPARDQILSQALDRLIIHKLQLAEANRLGIQVNQEMVTRVMMSIAQSNNLSLIRFRDLLEKEGASYQQFQKHIRENLAIRRLINQEVTNKIQISKAEVDQELTQQQKKQPDRDSGQAQNLSLVQQTRARHILIRTDELTSDEDAKERLTQLRERITNGENFGSLARAHSSDQASAIKGGELGWVNPEDMTPIFAKRMADTAVNTISQPFKTRFGWHIVQVLDRRDYDQSEDMRRMAARKTVQERKANEAKDQYLRKLRSEAYIEIRAQS